MCPINVSDPNPVYDNLVTQQGDNLVTQQGDNLAIYDASPVDNIAYVQVGNVTINRVYVGDSLRYEIDQTQVLTLTSAEDFDLKTYLDASGADYSKPIIINIASDQIIGGVTTEAFTISALPTHSNITINVNGQIQGMQGGNAISADEPIDIISVGEVLGEIEEGSEVDDSLITFVVSESGKILAGGGNGGNGGKGGNGDDKGGPISGPVYNTDAGAGELYYWYAGSIVSRWRAVQIGPVYSNPYGIKNSQLYWAGSKVTGSYYYILRQSLIYGTGGSGGIGGLGAGYNQARTDGADGSAGTINTRSGTGGKGGNGGDWGVDGSTGDTGSAGLYYSSTSSSNVRAGVNGTAGTTAGKAVISTSTVAFYGLGSPQAQALGYE